MRDDEPDYKHLFEMFMILAVLAVMWALAIHWAWPNVEFMPAIKRLAETAAGV